MKRYTLIAIAALLLSSCGIYSRYSRPEISDIAITDNLALPQWKDIFTDPCLQALIEKALEGNTDLKTASMKTVEASAQLKKATLSFFPSLDVNLDANSSQPFSFGASSSWEIDIFGRLTNEKRRAEASLEEAKAYEQAVKTGLIAVVAQGYFTLQGLDSQLDISKRTLENWNKSIRVMEALKSAGRTTEIAILQSRAKMMKLEASILTIQKNIIQAQNSLCTLVGTTLTEIERTELSEQSMPSFVEDISLETVAARPDVRSCEMALAQTFYTTNAARADFYPSIKLSGSAGWTVDGSVISNPMSFIWKAAGSLVQPVFRKGANKAALEVAKARQEEALQAFRQSLLDAGCEVNDALAGCQEADGRLEIDRQRVKTLNAAVEKIELLMKHSTTNYLEVLTAQQALLDAELDVVNDVVSLDASIVTLYHSLGGGIL